MYHLARAYSLNGRAVEASKLLGGLADMGLGVEAAGDGDFGALRGAAGWTERARVLESNHPDYALPTTGVVVGDELFYVANTQIDRMGAGGRSDPGPNSAT